MDFGWLPKALFGLVVLIVLGSVIWSKRNPPPTD
jgi:hypothetical protein